MLVGRVSPVSPKQSDFSVTRLHFDSPKDSKKFVSSNFIIESDGVFAFNLKHKAKVSDHRLKITLHNPLIQPQDDQNRIEIVYNSKLGIIFKGKYIPLNLKSVKQIYFIIGSLNSTSGTPSRHIWLSLNGLTFADIILEESLAHSTPLQMTFDSSYSDSIELENIK